MTPATDAAIRQAIDRKRLIAFRLKGLERIAEPHDYGIRNGRYVLLVYQIGGRSRSGRLPNWRMVHVDEMEAVRVLEQGFPGGRGAETSQRYQWDTLLARVKPA